MATRLRTLLLLLTLAAGLMLTACRGGGDDDDHASKASPPVTPTPSRTGEASASPPPTRPQKAIQGRFVVGDHRLWLRCVGGGSPAIVYVHDYGAAPSDPAGGGALGLQSRLPRSHRVCVYDRANVGRSGHVPGRQTGADAVSDLHALLASAGVTGPYVLIGSRFGALIADMYSAMYPNSVVGMVFVDGRLPQDEDVADRFFPQIGRASCRERG